jgi:hypothetical protein
MRNQPWPFHRPVSGVDLGVMPHLSTFAYCRTARNFVKPPRITSFVELRFMNECAGCVLRFAANADTCLQVGEDDQMVKKCAEMCKTCAGSCERMAGKKAA